MDGSGDGTVVVGVGMTGSAVGGSVVFGSIDVGTIEASSGTGVGESEEGLGVSMHTSQYKHSPSSNPAYSQHSVRVSKCVTSSMLLEVSGFSYPLVHCFISLKIIMYHLRPSQGVGAEVITTAGIGLGFSVSNATSVGLGEGSSVGFMVGSSDGDGVGSSVGVGLGFSVSTSTSVGLGEGSSVGFMVGSLDGEDILVVDGWLRDKKDKLFRIMKKSHFNLHLV